MISLSRRQLLRATPLALAALAAPLAPHLDRLAQACAELTDDAPGSPCGALVDQDQPAAADFTPWWVRTFLATRLWPTANELDQPIGPLEVGQYLRVQLPQNGDRLRVWDPRTNVTGYVGAEAVGPVGPPEWADYLNGQDGRWIDVTLSIPQHAVAMQGDLALRESLVTAGLRGETRPGRYLILRRVYNETMDSRTIPGLQDHYLLRNVLFTQYFTPDGAAIHYNWWGPPYGFGRPGSHGCLGMMYDDSKFYWDWADIGVPVVVHA
jgi:L,D-transpeptidase-like protein